MLQKPKDQERPGKDRCTVLMFPLQALGSQPPGALAQEGALADSSTLINFHLYVNFSYVLLLLIYCLILSWLKNILCIISVLLHLWGLILQLKMWSSMEIAPCALEK